MSTLDVLPIADLWIWMYVYKDGTPKFHNSNLLLENIVLTILQNNLLTQNINNQFRKITNFIWKSQKISHWMLHKFSVQPIYSNWVFHRITLAHVPTLSVPKKDVYISFVLLHFYCSSQSASATDDGVRASVSRVLKENLEHSWIRIYTSWFSNWGVLCALFWI